MATRSIKGKLLIGRGEAGRTLRQSLWLTHRLFNEGVAYYMRWLLRMRGHPLPDIGLLNPREEILRAARDAQKQKSGGAERTDDEIVAFFSKIYEEFKTGDSQSLANSFLGPFTNPESRGGLSVLEKVRVPGWIKLRADGKEWKRECLAWSRGEGQTLARSPGRKPAWAAEFLKWLNSLPPDSETFHEDPAWPARYEIKLGKDQKRVAGVSGQAVKPLYDLKILPALFQSATASYGDVLRRFDTAMFKYAIGSIQSWESWNARVAEHKRKLLEKRDSFLGAHFNPVPPWHEKLRAYEAARKRDLDENAFESGGPFRIGLRAVRGWDRLRERWMKSKVRTEEALWKIAGDLQTELRGKFGDPHLFKWLANPDNHGIWNAGAEDRLRLHAILNQIQNEVERAKDAAALTLPDAILHPKWNEWEAEGGGNLLTYAMRKDGERFMVKFSLIAKSDDGTYGLREYDVELASSGQLAQMTSLRERAVVYKDSGTRHDFSGKLGAANLLFARPWIEKTGKKSHALLEAGAIGSAYFKLSVDLEACDHPNIQVKAFKSNPKRIVLDLKDPELSAIPMTPAVLGLEGLKSGLRVMSVDLGLRSLAACSVFEICDVHDRSKGMSFPVRGTQWVAVHRRSFVLRLPGEDKSARADPAREERLERLYDLRAAIRRLKTLCSLAGREGDDRKEIYEQLIHGADWTDEMRKKRVDAILNPESPASLGSQLNSSTPVWQATVLKIHREWEKSLGAEISAWRNSIRRRPDHERGVARGKEFEHRGGISFDWIEELTNVRKILNAWSAHARLPGEVVRARETWGRRKDEKAREVDMDEKLLEHINNLKDDRLKKGADAMVMAALGYVYAGDMDRWMGKYPPCHLILFEDLNRYRFRTERPRRENSQLMRWGHRAIPQTVAMQGELYGIRIGEVGAGFTSRFHAASGAPGVRAQQVTEAMLESDWFKGAMERDGVDVKSLKLGAIAPLAGGELFVTLNRSNQPVVLHADINAAQNLQRRFWTRYDDPIRIACRVVMSGDQKRLVPKSIGKRVERVMGKYFVFVNCADDVYRKETVGQREFARLGGAGKAEEGVDADTVGVEGILDEAAEATGEAVTLFCDPSGIFFPRDHWMPQARFWSEVKNRIRKHLGLCAASPAGEKILV